MGGPYTLADLDKGMGGEVEDARGRAEAAGKGPTWVLPQPIELLETVGNPGICVGTVPEAPRDTWTPLVMRSMCRRL